MWKSPKTLSAGFNRGEVAKFKRLWPCSGLPNHQVWFEFAANGDLIDTNISDKSEFGAVAALISDARALLRGETVAWLGDDK